MRMYRCFLLVLLVAAIGFGVWYCSYFNMEQEKTREGTLVLGNIEGDGEDGSDECLY